MWKQTPSQTFYPDVEMSCVSDGEYVVAFRQYLGSMGRVVHLIIARIDAEEIKGWDVLQNIKNELIGKEVQACEIYPRESFLCNTAPLRHLWCLLDDELPFGYRIRATTFDEALTSPKLPLVW